ncbi:hypothetical protein FB565_007969 [Actinoplanes lutulentus]|uniref:Uncharacterized protein n=1 Tax=Actinoplanes lutulentus TaxID=1287878 RepID=A0A327Z6E5_9ACTN|nr:protease complex subunit PrcB family protein [Actinoplanes lutulentus]MBB2948186.1 hypothetical protein [Actinoplanes lutulentus]RAK31314.1 hypothetical protein B0I29_115120 [Actinoplanes lutulentus]
MSALQFRTLFRGSSGQIDDGPQGVFLIRDAATFTAYWRILTSGHCTAAGEPLLIPEPAVDLSTEAVVLVAIGRRPTTGCAVGIDRVLVDTDTLLVEATETAPDGGFDMEVAPAHLVAIRSQDVATGAVVLRLSVVTQ